MAEDKIAPIVVKKIKKVSGGHHGGAWKIAYADFVTAMMAFFLLMWLLGSTTKAQKEGISEYFQTPLKVALMGPSVGASDSILKDTGGKDVTKKQGQVKPVDGPKGKEKKVVVDDAKEALKKADAVKLAELKKRIEDTIEANEKLKKFKDQLKLDITSEGLRVQIIDDQNRPMFASARDDMQPYAKEILHEIGNMLNGVDNKITLSGHTDAKPYPNGGKGYGNWELSSDRANASRRELIASGMDEEKLLRVVGLAAASPYDKDNPFSPTNRRISIIVMNKQAEENFLRDSETLKVSDDHTVAQEIKEIMQKGSSEPTETRANVTDSNLEQEEAEAMVGDIKKAVEKVKEAGHL